MKYCVDCKYYRRDPLSYSEVNTTGHSFDKCVAPEAPRDPITAKTQMFCEIARTRVHLCGPSGAWYAKYEPRPRLEIEPKPSLWQRIKTWWGSLYV